MNLPLFIARGVAKSGTRSVSRTIILIAIAAVTISVATMVIASALVAGFKKEIADKIFGFWGQVHITDSSANYGPLETFNYPISNLQDFYPALDTTGPISYTDFSSSLVPTDAEVKTTNGGIRHIQQFIVLPGVVAVYHEGERFPTLEGMVLKGIAEDYDWEQFGRYLVAGEPLRISPDSMHRGILISQITADRLRLDVGDRLDFTFPSPKMQERPRAFMVTGIYKTGLEEFDRQFALVDIKQPRRLLDWRDDQIGGFEVFLDDLDDLEPIANYIHYDVLPQELYAESIRRKFSQLFQWLDVQDLNFALVLTLMLIVAVINMMTALLILILERTNMIGTLKALGQGNWSIRTIFLYYAGFIILTGLLLGNLVGLGLCFLQKQFGFIRLDEASYYLATAPIRIEWGTVIALNVGTFLITLLFLIVPSYLVTRVDPVKAIRFK